MKISVAPMVNDIQKQYGVILTFKDATVEKQLERQLRTEDHFHGIIVINFPVGADRCVRPMDINNYPKLGDIVQWFKTMTTNEYIKNVKNNSWPSFHKRLWQRDYYERIIRNKEELNRIRKYIIENPINI